MIANEMDELHTGILAFWDMLDQDEPPTANWKRWCMQMLFGLPFLADDEEPRLPLTHPAFIVAEGSEVLSMVAFHLDALNDNPAGPIARALWERVYKLSGDVLAALDCMDSREGAN